MGEANTTPADDPYAYLLFRTIAEIQKRFKPFLENGDDSQIPPDLQRCIYTIVRCDDSSPGLV